MASRAAAPLQLPAQAAPLPEASAEPGLAGLPGASLHVAGLTASAAWARSREGAQAAGPQPKPVASVAAAPAGPAQASSARTPLGDASRTPASPTPAPEAQHVLAAAPLEEAPEESAHASPAPQAAASSFDLPASAARGSRSAAPVQQNAAHTPLAPGAATQAQAQSGAAADAQPLAGRAAADAASAASAPPYEPAASHAKAAATHPGALGAAASAAQFAGTPVPLPGAHSQEVHPPAALQNPAPAAVQVQRAAPGDSSPAAAQSDPFVALDGATAPAPAWLRAGPHSAEAGYLDPSLGWVGVRADAVGNAVYAHIVPATADAAQMLNGHIAGLSAFMAEHHDLAADVTVGAPEGRGLDAALNQEQSSGQDTAGHANAQQDSRSGATGWGMPPAARSPASVLPPSAAGIDAFFTTPLGATISLVA